MRISLVIGLVASLGLMLSCGDDEGTSGSKSSNGGNGGVGAAGGGGAGAAGGGGSTPMVMTNANCEAPEGAPGTLQLTSVGDFSFPMMVTYAPGDSERMYVVERLGVIQNVPVAGGAPTEFLDISGVIDGLGGEGGLLGLAFHPDYVNNGRFFVHYTPGNPFRSTIAEFARDAANPEIADPGSEIILLEVNQPAENHNGGSVEFNLADGFLYVGLGDGGAFDDIFMNGQNKMSHLGTLLRLDVDGGSPYAIPAGNITDGLPEIYHYGLRNPYRFAFDQCNGDVYIGDVGQNAFEEVDIAAANSGPINWGWNCREASSDFGNGPICPQGETFVDPQHEYAQVGSMCGGSITGGVVYRGSAIGWLRGAYFWGDFCTGDVGYLRWDGTSVTEVVDVSAQLNIGAQEVVGWGNDNDGNVYVALIQDGGVYRVDAL